MPKILICAAMDAEAQGVLQGIRQAGLEGHFEILKTGIGPRRAMQALESRLAITEARERPAWIISTGFAGSWSPELRVGDWVEGRFACDEAGEAIDLSETPIRDLATRTLFCSVTAIHASPPKAIIEKIREKTQSNLPCAVDMESFAIARVARSYGISASALRYVSDSAEEPLPEFVRHFTRANAPAPGEGLLTRARSVLDGVSSLARQPASLRKLLADGSRWRRELAEGWARLSVKMR